MSPEGNHVLRGAALATLGLVLIGGSFMFASGDFAYSAKSLFAAVSESFSSSPTITISRSSDSPNGIINPGRLQAIAVLDVNPRFLKQVAYIQQIPVSIQVESPDTSMSWKLGMSQFFLDYRYCLSKGDVYGYGYSYDDTGLFCRSINTYPSSFGTNDGKYEVIFTQSLPVYPNQVSGKLTISANPQYRAPDQTGREISQLVASVAEGAVAYTNVCTTNESGNIECQSINPEVNVYLAAGNVLNVAPHYGYGYAYIDGISPSDASIGDTINVWGWNLSKTTESGAPPILWMFGPQGYGSLIKGNSASNDNVFQFILDDRYSVGDTDCSNGCQSFSVEPGQYSLFAYTKRGRSNSVYLNVVDSQPQSLTCDATAQAVVNSVGGCSVIDSKKYQNVYVACCQITKTVLLTLLDNALADGVVDDHEKSVLLTALNSYLF